MHNCRWVGCTRRVADPMWGCKTHWFMLPKAIRDRIWAAYRPGQEEDLEVSESWVEADRAARQYSARGPA